MSVLLVWGDDAKSIGFDTVMSYDYSGASTPTSYAVEKGPNVTDHIDRPLAPFTFEIFVSNTPLRAANFSSRLQNYGGSMQPLQVIYRAMRDTKTTKTIKPPKNRQIPGFANPLAIAGAIAQEIIKSEVTQPWLETEETTGSIAPRTLQFDTQFDLVQDAIDTLEEIRSTGALVTCYSPHKTFVQCALSNYKLAKGKDTGPFAAKGTITVQPIRIVTTKQVPRPDPTQGRTLPAVAKGPQTEKEKRVTIARVLAGAFGFGSTEAPTSKGSVPEKANVTPTTKTAKPPAGAGGIG